jgi:hypothetical protein
MRILLRKEGNCWQRQLKIEFEVWELVGVVEQGH